MMQLSQVSIAVNGQQFGSDVTLSGVSINSRTKCSQKLFIALVGDRFDAHEFIGQAQQAGASAALVEKKLGADIVVNQLPYVLVENSHQALKDLAAWWRKQFTLPVIGITGSVGKTSVKEMLACIFSEVGAGTVTQGNLNNEIGVPLTLLNISDNDEYAIIEMGMNHPGEISRLSQITKPTIALINNAAAAHIEGLGSVEAVAKAKAEIFEGLSTDGVAVINLDDRHSSLWTSIVADRSMITFGLCNSADVSATYNLTDKGLTMQVKALADEFELSLPLYGKHNVMNILASIAVAKASNISINAIVAGLIKYQPISGRLNVIKVGDITLIDDSYNANPASMQAAIEVLGRFKQTVLIAGDMRELGAMSKQAHRHLGKLANENGIDKILAVGEFAIQTTEKFESQSKIFTDQNKLLEYLDDNPITKGTVLVKGSRSAKMEHIVECLIKSNSEQVDVGSTQRVG